MSVAFTRESDAEAVAADLPDRPVPSHPNYVTPTGLAAIDAALAAARAAQAAARGAGEISSDRTAMALATRELRYWSSRRASAQLVESRPAGDTIVFGSTVTLAYGDGHSRAWRIVGDDEADPAGFSVSWVSPLARAVTGKSIGDIVTLAGNPVEIVAID